MGFRFIDGNTKRTPTPPSHEELQHKKTTPHEEIIWDLSSQIGELKNENMMLKLQIKEIKNILNFG